MVGGKRCASEEQIKEQAHQSHSTTRITYMYMDNEGEIYKERGFKYHLVAVKWMRLQLALRRVDSGIRIFNIKLDFLFSDLTLK